jgi:Uncharacterized conserved protein (DUF2190)
MMVPSHPEYVRTVVAAAALAECRFVTVAGSYSAAGGYALGVTYSSAGAAGDLVPVVVNDTAEVEAGEAIAAGDALMAAADGRAMKLTGTNTKVGRALTAASTGLKLEVLLIPN